MGQYFLIANQGKQQFLDPFVIPSSERFPSILNSTLMPCALSYLIVGSKNQQYTQLKNSGFYTQKYLGAWYGDPIDLLGDYDEEEGIRNVRSKYENISLEMTALLFEINSDFMVPILEETNKGSNVWLNLIQNLLAFENYPEALLFEVKKMFGENWKIDFYKRLSGNT